MLSPYETKPSSRTAGIHRKSGRGSPAIQATIRLPSPEKTPLIVVICTELLSPQGASKQPDRDSVREERNAFHELSSRIYEGSVCPLSGRLLREGAAGLPAEPPDRELYRNAEMVDGYDGSMQPGRGCRILYGGNAHVRMTTALQTGESFSDIFRFVHTSIDKIEFCPYHFYWEHFAVLCGTATGTEARR